MTASPRLLPCAALALALTLLNALKPLHIDDAAYYCYAAQIAHDPLSPYDFEILWGQRPQPANEVLAPPVLPYWWAAGIRLFGDSPGLWKLWLLPVNLLLVLSLHALARRFARGLELPVLCLIVLSPSLLPGLNLMLDVPALALSLGALALFLRAADRDSAWAALAAGLVAGLAMQTKYTALLTPAVLLLYAGLFRRPRLGLVAVAAAVAVFASWEVFVALRHGQSHFLVSLGRQGRSLLDQFGPLFRALLNLTGGLAPATGLLALAALGLRARAVLAAGVAVLFGYGLVALVPPGESGVTASGLVCRVLGLFLTGTLAVVARRLLSERRGLSPPSDNAGSSPAAPHTGPRRVEWFLCLWLALEVGGYFALTPFPAARRVLGVLVVAALLTGRLAARTCRRAPRRGLVWAVTAGGVLLGLAFYGVDLREAAAERRGVERAARRVFRQTNGKTAWYTGTWGLKFYAERAGLRPVVPDRSALRAGDWLVIPDPPLPHQEFVTEGVPLSPAGRVTVADALPLRTVWCYYGSNVPLDHQEGPRVSLRLYRVTADFTPASPPGAR
jgi:4-amino-4-deoxy-L-arabinose transferase-like glycosyltransferase